MTAASAGARDAPLVAWAPRRLDEDSARQGRTAGAAAGFLVALAYGLASSPVGQPGPILITVPTLVAGTIGGWLFGPTAWNARLDADWLRSIVGLGFVALFIGALATGLSLGILSAATSGASLGKAIELVWAMTLVAVTIGLIFPGLLMLPITLAAAAVWAVVMVVLRAWASPNGD